MKLKAGLGSRASYAALISGILCLVPYPYLPPIGSNTMLMYLWPLFAIIAVVTGILGVIAEKKDREAGGRLESWFGLTAGAGLLLVLFLTSGIYIFS